MGGRSWVCVALLWAVTTMASAQAGTASAPAVPAAEPELAEATAPAPGATPAAELEDHALAAELYDLAFDALASGKRAHAREILLQLRSQFPADLLALRAAELLGALDAADQAATEAVKPSPPPSQAIPAAQGSARGATAAGAAVGGRPTGAARAEVVFFQTVHGLALGAELCTVLECNDIRAWALSIMLGAGSGLGVSLYATRDGVTPGLARALTSGVEWGVWHALMLGFATDAFEGGVDEDRRIAGGLMLGQLAGLGAGALGYHLLRPTAGQVSLTSSGGIWTTVAAGLSVAISGTEPDENVLLGVLLAASDIGLLAGGYFASRQPMSAGRVLVLDAGGLLGTLTGGGLAALAMGEGAEPEPVAALALLGMLSGLSVSYVLTRDWDADEGEHAAAPVSLAVLPTQGGALAQARVEF